MKKIFIYALLLLLASCAEFEKEINKNKELYSLTDYFVQSLQTSYRSYGLFSGEAHKKITSDMEYQVMPLGRLINVKILRVVGDDIYYDLKRDLEEYYKHDSRVNRVYINNAGTIMIDCRN
jgi:hypothetical protein